MNDETRRQTKDFNDFDLVFFCSSLSIMKLVKAPSSLYSSTKRQLAILQKSILYVLDTNMIGIFFKKFSINPNKPLRAVDYEPGRN